MTIGEKIRWRRRTLALTQQELAEKAGCSRNHVSSLESSKCLPSLKLWLRVSVVLGIEEARPK